MSIEEFAAKKAADVAFPAMVAAWFSAVASLAALIFAFFAVHWAKKAAQAAQDQIGLLKKQLDYSEPQPIVLLGIRYEAVPQYVDGRCTGNANLPVIVLENVGETPAFDIEVSDLLVLAAVSADWKRLSFAPEPMLLSGKEKTLHPRSFNPSNSAIGGWLTELSSEILKQVAQMDEDHQSELHAAGWSLGRLVGASISPFNIKFRNLRGKHFENDFLLDTANKQKYRFHPVYSLVDQSVQIKPIPKLQ